MLNNIDFNRFHIFYHIYRQRSIGEAARALHVTPSAISQHLKKLEAELNLSLFTRLHKKLVPTAGADQLFQMIEPFFEKLANGLKVLKDGQQNPTGTLRIGAPVEFGKNCFPQLIGQFRECYPLVSFALTLENSDRLLEMIRNGELDFALVDLFLSQRKYLADTGLYHADPVMDETVVMACSRKYFTQHLQGDISLNHLLRQNYIAYGPNHLALNRWFKHHFNKRPTNLKTVLTVDSIQAIRSAIANHIGLGIITRNQNENENFIAIQPGTPDIINTISIVQLLDKIPSLTEKTFQHFLKTAIPTL